MRESNLNAQFAHVPYRFAANSNRNSFYLSNNESESRNSVATEQKNAGFYRALIDNVPDIIVVLDADCNLRFSSRSIEDVTGFKPAELVGRQYFQFIHREDLEKTQTLIKNAIQRGGKIKSFEYRHLCRDGSWRMFETTGENLLADPAVGGIVLSSRDVTQQRLVEEQLLQSQKTEAVRRIAHDFNNLLTVIMCYTKLSLEHEDLNPSVKSWLNDIYNASEQAFTLISKLRSQYRKQPDAESK